MNDLFGPKLTANFFARDPVRVARAMLGTFLVHELPSGERLVARIVETEAYGKDDPACHAFGNEKRVAAGGQATGRSALLFGPPGLAYVYLNYGVHWLFNVVAGRKGEPGAVLVRAAEPVLGVERMRQLRPKVRRREDLTNGPGKLTVALGIGSQHNGLSLTARGAALYLTAPNDSRPLRVATSGRVGITKAVDFPWRFFLAGHPFVSPAIVPG